MPKIIHCPYYTTRFTSCLILILLVGRNSYGVGKNSLDVLSETVIVTSLPGDKPGQYIHWIGAGFNLCPRCFAIDPNDGTFYIPEVDTKDNIRVHKFDKTGKFIDMLKLESQAEMITDIAVDFNGDLYLNRHTTHGECYITRYDKNGEILNHIGPRGPITAEDINKTAILSPENEPYRNKLFRGNIYSFVVNNARLELVLTNEYDISILYRFEGKTGQVLGKESTIPLHVEQVITDKKVKNEVIWENHHSQKRIEGIVCSVIDRNGEFYYMSVSPDILKIWKVNFKKP
ncbi:MAG: hypothetical protein ABFD91_05335 [Anaerohalosphaeraceae bacterium]